MMKLLRRFYRWLTGDYGPTEWVEVKPRLWMRRPRKPAP